MISYVHEFIGVCYDIPSDFICLLASARAGSNAYQGRLNFAAQKRPRACSNAPWFESNAAAACPLRLYVLFKISLH